MRSCRLCIYSINSMCVAEEINSEMIGRFTKHRDREIKTIKNFSQLPLPHPPSTGAVTGSQHRCHASITALERAQHMCPPTLIGQKNEMTDLLNIQYMCQLKIGF